MLNITGQGTAHTCDGVSRRDFLQVGTLGAAGITLSELERARAEGKIRPEGDRRSVMCGTEDYFHIAAGLRMNTDLLKVIRKSGLGLLAFSPQDTGRLAPDRELPKDLLKCPCRWQRDQRSASGSAGPLLLSSSEVASSLSASSGSSSDACDVPLSGNFM